MTLHITTIPITMLASTLLSLLSALDDPGDPAYHDPHHDASLYSSLAAQRSRRSHRPCRYRRSPSRCPPCYSSHCSSHCLSRRPSRCLPCCPSLDGERDRERDELAGELD